MDYPNTKIGIVQRVPQKPAIVTGYIHKVG